MKLCHPLGGGPSLERTQFESLKNSYGSHFAGDKPVLDAELWALALMIRDSFRKAERVLKESRPSTASQTLSSWAERLGVSIRPGDSLATIRAACSAKYRAVAGPTQQVVLDSVTQLLQGGFVSLQFFYGEDGYAESYHPDHPGDPDIDLMGDAEGQWTSVRNHMLVVVRKRPSDTLDHLDYILNVQLTDLLDTLLPAHATFGFHVVEDGDYEGFIIGESLIGYASL